MYILGKLIKAMAELLSGGVERSYLRDLNGIATQQGDTISVRYTGKLSNGNVFDSNADGIKPEFSFKLGSGQVIKGWDTGLLGVNVGDVLLLSIPADQAYGANATGSIPANSPLNFQVEVFGRSNASGLERLSAIQFGVPDAVLQAYLASSNPQEAELRGLDAVDQLAVGPKGGVILAAAGNDSLTGGLGNDLLAGGLGSDIFVLSGGNDVISDFNQAEGDLLIGRTNLQRSLIDTTTGLAINYSDGSSTVLTGLNSASFDPQKAFFQTIDSITSAQNIPLAEASSKRKNQISYDYLASHQDLLTVVGKDLELAKKHFFIFGFKEGRSIDRFNNAAYLEANPGVANSAYFRDRASEHFIIYGSKEGRAAAIY